MAYLISLLPGIGGLLIDLLKWWLDKRNDTVGVTDARGKVILPRNDRRDALRLLRRDHWMLGKEADNSDSYDLGSQ